MEQLRERHRRGAEEHGRAPDEHGVVHEQASVTHRGNAAPVVARAHVPRFDGTREHDVGIPAHDVFQRHGERRQRRVGVHVARAGDVEQLPFPDASFDIVASRYSAHHYPRPSAALREFARVLRPSGVFLLVDVVSPDDPTQDTFLNAIELLRDPSHVRDHSVAQWHTMLTSAGFTSELLGMWDLRLEFESWVARMRTPPLAVSQLRALLDGAPREVRVAMSIAADDYSFNIPVALLRGDKLTR